MNNLLSYKGYIGSIEFSEEDGVFFGKVLGIRALISYEGTNAKELVEDFHAAIDDYLTLCADEGIEPEVAYKGRMQPLADEEWREDSLEMYACALYLSGGDSSELRTLLQPDGGLSSWARFVLLVQLHDPAAVSLAESVWKHYALGLEEMAMLFVVIRPELAREYYFVERERLVEQDNSTARKELKLLDTLFYDPAYRQSYLDQWRPSFPALWTDCYVDW